MTFKDTYRPQEGDMCARKTREDRYEVSVYDGKAESWQDTAVLSLAELNKRVRKQQFIGTYNEWEYYRPLTSA